MLTVDWAANRGRCARLNAHEREVLVHTLALAIVLGGRIRTGQWQLLHNACGACGISVDSDRVRHLQKMVIDGQGVG